MDETTNKTIMCERKPDTEKLISLKKKCSGDLSAIKGGWIFDEVRAKIKFSIEIRCDKNHYLKESDNTKSDINRHLQNT